MGSEVAARAELDFDDPAGRRVGVGRRVVVDHEPVRCLPAVGPDGPDVPGHSAKLAECAAEPDSVRRDEFREITAEAPHAGANRWPSVLDVPNRLRRNSA